MLDLLSGGSALWVLFSTGFLSATLLPGGSEANLIALLQLAEHPATILVGVATLGNTLGGMTNYWLGRLLPAKLSKEKQGQRAITWIKQHGYWVLLLSWLPIIGDPLCLAAGWLRLSHWRCALLVLIGKALRYSVLALIINGFL